MTQQLSDDRTQALRAMLVELAAEQHATGASGVDITRRVLVTSAAVGLAASATILAFQPSPSGPGTGADPSASGGPVSGPSTGIASRVKLYGSLDELVADSGAVVIGTVVRQEPGPDGSTVSTVDVERSFTPPGLGSTSPEPAVTVDEDGSVRVRTFDGVVSSVPSVALAEGTGYLLFLTPTGLPDAGDDEFFITGVVAGIYEAADDRYVRATQDGDVLPDELSVADLG